MNVNVRRIVLFAGILLTGCCVLSLAVLWFVPVDESGTPERDRQAAAEAEVALVDTAEGAETTLSTATYLPVSPAATATNSPPTRTPRNTHTPRPTNTRPSTATPRPTNTLRPTSTVRPTFTATAIPHPTSTPTLVATATAAASPTVASLPGEIATVTDIIDGDTIAVSMNGQSYRVRYIGINTPETGDTCGKEATAANAALVEGQTVRMVKDVRETDRYGRLLRYVYVGNIFVNGELVAGGWAQAVDYPPDTGMSSVLHGLMSQGAGRGCALVSGALPTVPVRGPEPIVPVPQPTSPSSGGNCDPSYPTVCIPPPPPDLDCGDIPYRRFQVLPPDPHNFDGSDKDGIGCESG